VTGSSTQRKGVVPDVILPDEYEFLKYREKDNESSLPWDEMERAKFQVWPNNSAIAAIAAKANDKIANDTSMIAFKKTLAWVSTQMDRPVHLKLDKYIAFRKQLQSTMIQNDNRLKLKDSMQVTALKADYNKFYNNPDKTKQDRYQAWLKVIAKDAQINEASKLLSEFFAQNWVAKKTN
jgi:carboxyl-terminal processing protease